MSEDLRYPIGKLVRRPAIDATTREQLIADIEQLPAELRTAVQEEAVRAEAAANDFGAGDIQSAKTVWTQNGGQLLALSAQDEATFLKTVQDSAMAILREKPGLMAEYERFARLSQKYKA